MQSQVNETYLCYVVDVLADGGHVVCALKELLAVKLPAGVAARGLDLGPDLQVAVLPQLQGLLGLGGLGLDLGRGLSVK